MKGQIMYAPRALSLVAAGLLSLGGLTACGGGMDPSPGAPGTISTNSSATSQSQSQSPDPVLSEPTSQDLTVAKFGHTFTLDNGNQLTVSKPVRFVSSDSAMPGNAKGALFTFTAKNGTAEPVTLSTMSVNAINGETEQTQIYDSAQDISGNPSTRLRPGSKVTWTVAFTGNASGTWVMDISTASGPITFTS